MGEAQRRGSFEERRRQAIEREGKTMGMLVFYSKEAEDPDDKNIPWTPIKSDEVPDWLRNDPDKIGRLVERGYCCRNDELKENIWYCAQKAKTPEKSPIIIK